MLTGLQSLEAYRDDFNRAMHKKEEGGGASKSQEEDPDLQELKVTHDSISTKAAHFLVVENKSKFEHALKIKFHQSVFGLSHGSEMQV